VKRVLAITALLMAALAVPASASTLCVNGHFDINGTTQDVNQCV
jgi:hypothetical protein